MKKQYRLMGALALTVVFILLGFWQVNAYHETVYQRQLFQKRQHEEPISLENALKLDNPLYAQVTSFGHYLPNKKIILMNQYLHFYKGTNIYTPFLVAGTNRVILVDRGWVRTVGGNTFQFEDMLGKMNTQISGFLTVPRRSFYFGKTIARRHEGFLYVRTIDFPLLEKQLGVSFYPYVLRLDPLTFGSFTQNWPELKLNALNHVTYAIQWLVLALVMLVSIFFIWLKK